VIGLLSAPCALTILKPNRYCLIWLLYFVAMMAIDPFLSPLIIKIWEGKLVGIRLEEFALPESFVSVVIDNASWYGPQLGLFM
jgi:hypothetical protein